jgi:hypothetical protein
METAFVALVGLFLVGMCLGVACAPADLLLRFDQRTGRAVYERELARTGSLEAATRRAARFYRVLGLVGAGFALIVCTVLAVVSLA